MATLDCNKIKDSLGRFWQSVLDCADKPNGGLVLSVPMNYPDGWQITIEINPLSDKRAVLSDSGRTLGRFFESGQNIDSSSKLTHAFLKGRTDAFGIHRNGLELWKSVSLPLQGEDLHVFAEALVGIAYLEYRHEATIMRDGPVGHSVRKVLIERKLSVDQDTKLKGLILPQVEIDFFVEGETPIAIQAINRGGRIKDLMEQWGFRWNDLKAMHETLLPVMIYDADKRPIDVQSREIGKRVCRLFCPYQEIHKLGELIDQVRGPRGRRDRLK